MPLTLFEFYSNSQIYKNLDEKRKSLELFILEGIF